MHREAVRQLIAKFNAEDRKQYGSDSVTPGRGWNCEFVTGSIPDGSYVHVFVHENESAAPELLAALEAVDRADVYVHERGEALAKARAAIRKAKGEA